MLYITNMLEKLKKLRKLKRRPLVQFKLFLYSKEVYVNRGNEAAGF